jgi:hypothetical protein
MGWISEGKLTQNSAGFLDNRESVSTEAAYAAARASLTMTSRRIIKNMNN